MICSDLLEAYMATIKEGFHCATDSDGRLCVVTPYLYPDHDFIEVFVKDKGETVVVSDLGETLRHLDTLGMDVVNTPKLKYAAERIAAGLQVSIQSGVIVRRGRAAEVGKLVFEVLSAIKLVSSLVYGNRAYEPVGFDEEVQEFVKSNGIDVERRVSVPGVSGSEYTVSFKLHAPGGGALVQTISPRTKGGVKSQVNSAFRMWSDIDPIGPFQDKKFCLVNDESLPFRAEDLTLLGRVSRVHRWTERQGFVEDLKRVA